MKVVIPVKKSSTRVPDKNFRPFYKDESLLDIKLRQLSACFDADDIYISSEDATVADLAKSRGIGFIGRERHLADNETPYAYVVSQVCAEVPGEDEIAWCHVTDPLFDQYAACLNAWETGREDHDSLVVVYPLRNYLLDANHKPMGFGFGPWHVRSQRLPQHYQLNFTFSILRRRTALDLGPIGADPYWFHAANRTVDIDDMDDFAIASAIYAALQER